MNPTIQKALMKISEGKGKILVDFDGVIADTNNTDYSNSQPDESMISLLNYLHDKGNKIIIFTARGSMSGRDWKQVTEYQLKSWNVQYDELIVGKPSADLILDDIAIRPDEFYDEVI